MINRDDFLINRDDILDALKRLGELAKAHGLSKYGKVRGAFCAARWHLAPHEEPRTSHKVLRGKIGFGWWGRHGLGVCRARIYALCRCHHSRASSDLEGI